MELFAHSLPTLINKFFLSQAANFFFNYLQILAAKTVNLKLLACFGDFYWYFVNKDR